MLNGRHLRIDLGSGDPTVHESTIEGYLHQDIDPEIPGLDIVCDVRDLDKHVAKGACTRIRASHVMEHFGTKEIPKIFRMIHELLEDHGIFEIIVPNLKWHSQLVLSGQDEKAVYYCFGGQLDEWDYHKTGFTQTILAKRLEEAGFAVLDLIDASSITCIAKKI